MTLYQVRLPHATFGLLVRDGVVIRAAPIAAWAVGKRSADVLDYYLRRDRGAAWEAVTEKVG